jgi:hypothetical protein
MRHVMMAVGLMLAGASEVGEARADEDADDAVEEPALAVMNVEGLHLEANAGLWVVGTLGEPRGAREPRERREPREPVTFRLAQAMGCARDVQLRAVAAGPAFCVELGEAELTDAFACAIDAERGDEALPTITLTPDADGSDSADLSLDSTFAVAARTLDASDGHVVRFTVAATSAIDEALVTLDGTSYRAVIAAADEGSDVPTTAVFDVPARAWASSVVKQGAAEVDVKLDGGAHRAMTLRPRARVATVAPVAPIAEEDCH